MGVKHNYDDFADALDEMPGRVKTEVGKPLAKFTNIRFGAVATDRYMREGGASFDDNAQAPPNRQTGAGSLRRQGGRLTQAVLGSFKDGSREHRVNLQVTANGVTWRKDILVEYAWIHEHGGTIRVPVNEGMRGLFWRKYYEAGGGGEAFETAQGATQAAHWKALAIGAEHNTHFTIQMPARPYAGPAMDDIEPDVAEKGADLVVELMNSL